MSPMPDISGDRCDRCGKRLNVAAVFCPRCGNRVRDFALVADDDAAANPAAAAGSAQLRSTAIRAAVSLANVAEDLSEPSSLQPVAFMHECTPLRLSRLCDSNHVPECSRP